MCIQARQSKSIGALFGSTLFRGIITEQREAHLEFILFGAESI
jgi:hypothetical protein